MKEYLTPVCVFFQTEPEDVIATSIVNGGTLNMDDADSGYGVIYWNPNRNT